MKQSKFFISQPFFRHYTAPTVDSVDFKIGVASVSNVLLHDFFVQELIPQDSSTLCNSSTGLSPILPALDSLLPQLSQIPRPKVADCSDDLSVAGVLLCVDPPRVPDTAAVAAVALQVLLDIA